MTENEILGTSNRVKQSAKRKSDNRQDAKDAKGKAQTEYLIKPRNTPKTRKGAEARKSGKRKAESEKKTGNPKIAIKGPTFVSLW